MKKLTMGIIVTTILLSVGFSFGGSAAKKCRKDLSKVSKPFEYCGYTYPGFRGYVKKSEYVEMRDGAKIAVDIFLPSDGPRLKSFPTVFQFLPYTRAFAYPNMPWYEKIWAKLKGISVPVIDSYVMNKEVPVLLSYGYAYVIADMRGTGASFGRAFHPIPENFEDVEDMLTWITEQEWCNGNIGMYGGSYLGYIQLVAASRQNKALKCIVPTVAPTGFADLAYPGGIYSQGFLDAWSFAVNYLNRNYYIPKKRPPLPKVLPAMPVVDEDNDGDLIDEIPIYNKDGHFLDGNPPKYKDGQPREGIYYKATLEHKDTVTFGSWVGDIPFADLSFPPPYENVDVFSMVVHSFMPKIMETGIAIYDVGGWHDANIRGTIEVYSTLKKTNPSRMTIMAAYHTGQGPYWKHFGEDEKKIFEGYALELVRFFDRYLKGIENGIDKEKPIYIYVQNGGGWRFESEWPLARQKITDFYFVQENSLSPEKSTPGADKYVPDFTHDSRYGSTAGNRYLGAAGIVPDKLPWRNEKDKKCLTYTSPPLAQDTEVTGHPTVRFWVSSTADYGDFFVYLEEVDEKGAALLVTEGQHRAGFANLQDNNSMGSAGIDILPELPWYGYKRSDYTDKILANGNVVELYFDLMPTSWIFKKGRRIRVAISAADWPSFRLHPKLSPNNKPDDPDNIVPTITLLRDSKHPSGIQLPIIPE